MMTDDACKPLNQAPRQPYEAAGYTSGYGGQDGHAAPYPPAASNYGAPQAAPCSQSREELDQHLSTSAYGANAAIFNCYFRPAPQGSPPLCITCGCPIGMHSSRNAAMAAQAAIGNPVMGGPVLIAPGFGMPGFGGGALPMGMIVADMNDTVLVPYSQASKIASCILIVIGLVQIVAFTVSGVFSRAPFVMAVPILLLVVACFLCLRMRCYRIVFHKNATPPQVEVAERGLLGCSRTLNLPVSAFQSTVLRATNVRVNRQQIYEVVVMDHTTGAALVPLYRGPHYEAAAQYGGWQSYLLRYGVRIF